jgi:hypothetical protein
MISNSELKKAWKEALSERDSAVSRAGGFWGDDYPLETRLAIALDDARMAIFFIHKIIERLPDDEEAP